MKVTRMSKPQSSCPFKSARQKIFGLGYGLIVLVYEKRDDPETRTATLVIKHSIFVEKNRTSDYQMTTGLRKILANNGNQDDIIAFLGDSFLPVDSITAGKIADELLSGKPLEQGYLTISNARQWRLQYSRIVQSAGRVDGIARIW